MSKYNRIIRDIKDGEYEQAIKLLSSELDQSEITEERKLVYLYLRAVCRLYRSDIQDAVLDTEQIIKIKSNHADAYSLRGWLMFCQGKCQQAQQDYERAEQFLNSHKLSEEISSFKQPLSLYVTIYNYFFLESGQSKITVGKLHNDLRKEKWRIPLVFAARYVITAMLHLDENKRNISSGVRSNAEQALGCASDSAVNKTFWAYIIRGTARIARGHYKYAVKEFDKAIAINSKIGWVYSLRAQAKQALNNYKHAFNDYYLSIQLSEETFPRIVGSLVNAIDSAVIAHKQDAVLSYQNKETLQSLLHLASKRGYSQLTKKLLAISDHKQQELILAEDATHKTPLMLAYSNHQHKQFPLLLSPLLSRVVTINCQSTNKALLEALSAVVRTEEHGLSQSRVRAVSSTDLTLREDDSSINGNTRLLFTDDNAFEKAILAMHRKINVCAESSKKKELTEKATQLILRKFKFDIESSDPAEKKCVAVSSCASVVPIVRSVLNMNVANHSGINSGYIALASSFLDIFVSKEAQKSISLSSLTRLLQNADLERSYFSIFVPVIKLVDYLREGKYSFAMREAAAIVKQAVGYFGSTETIKISNRIFNLIEDLSQEVDNEFCFLSTLPSFLHGEKPISIQHTIALIAAKKVINKNFMRIKQQLEQGEKEKARKILCYLIYYALTVLTPIYKGDSQLAESISQSISQVTTDTDTSWDTITKMSEQNQYQLMIKIMKQIHTQLPNQELKEALEHLDYYVEDWGKQSSSFTNFIILFKFASRFLIDYGDSTDNKAVSYTGTFCLLASQLYLVKQKLNRSTNCLSAMNIIVSESSTFLLETSKTFNSLAYARITISLVVFEILLASLSKLTSMTEFSLDQILTITRANILAGKNKIAVILSKYGQDKVIKNIAYCVDVALKAVVLGEGIKFVYNIFTGDALKLLQENLEKYLPIGATAPVLQALHSSLQMIPGVGTVVSTAQFQSELKEFRSFVKQRIDQSENRVSMRLYRMEARLTYKLELGLDQIECSIDLFNQRMDHFSEQLNEIKKLIMLNRRVIVDIGLRGEIGSTIKRIKRRVNESLGSGVKIQETKLKSYHKVLDYLIYGSSKNERIKSVYNPDLQDSWSLFWSCLYPENRNRHMPNIELWINLLATLVVYLNRVDQEVLFKERLDLDSFMLIFQQAEPTLQSLIDLNSISGAKRIFDTVCVKHVEREQVYLLISYCSLVGIPLKGYGEHFTYWTDQTDSGLAWRSSFLTAALKRFSVENPNNSLTDIVAVAKQVIHRFGLAIRDLAQEQLLRAQSQPLKNKANQIIAIISKFELVHNTLKIESNHAEEAFNTPQSGEVIMYQGNEGKEKVNEKGKGKEKVKAKGKEKVREKGKGKEKVKAKGKEKVREKGKEKGSIKNRVGNSHNKLRTYWYIDDDIDGLLKHYLGENIQVELLTAMLATNWRQDNDLRQSLIEFNRLRFCTIRQGKTVKDRVIIPVNLNQNHWSLLYLIYQRDGAQLPSIYYFDPLGSSSPPKELVASLQDRRLFPGVEIINIGQRVQDNGYDCGPWVIEAARLVASKGCIPGKSHSICHARQEHMKVLYPSSYPLESSQSQEKGKEKVREKGKEKVKAKAEATNKPLLPTTKSVHSTVSRQPHEVNYYELFKKADYSDEEISYAMQAVTQLPKYHPTTRLSSSSSSIEIKQDGINFSYIRQLMARVIASTVKVKQSVPVIGITAVGKSSLITNLLGINLDIKTEEVDGEDEYVVVPKPKHRSVARLYHPKLPITGSTLESVTLFAENFTSIFGRYTYTDTPGLKSIRHTEEELVVEGLSFEIAIKNSEKQSAVIAAFRFEDADSRTSFAVVLKDFLKLISKLLVNIHDDRVAKSLIFVATKSDDHKLASKKNRHEKAKRLSKKLMKYQNRISQRVQKSDNKCERSAMQSTAVESTGLTGLFSYMRSFFNFGSSEENNISSYQGAKLTKKDKAAIDSFNLLCIMNTYDMVLYSVATVTNLNLTSLENDTKLKQIGTYPVLLLCEKKVSVLGLSETGKQLKSLCERSALPSEFTQLFPKVGEEPLRLKAIHIPQEVYKRIAFCQAHTVHSDDHIPFNLVVADIRNKNSRKEIESKIKKIEEVTNGLKADDFKFCKFNEHRRKFEDAIQKIMVKGIKHLERIKSIPFLITQNKRKIEILERIISLYDKINKDLKQQLSEEEKVNRKIGHQTERLDQVTERLESIQIEIEEKQSELGRYSTRLQEIDTDDLIERHQIDKEEKRWRPWAPPIIGTVGYLLGKSEWELELPKWVFHEKRIPIAEVRKEKPRGHKLIDDPNNDRSQGIYKATYEGKRGEDGYSRLWFYAHKKYLPQNRKRIRALKSNIGVAEERLTTLQYKQDKYLNKYNDIKAYIEKLRHGHQETVSEITARKQELAAEKKANQKERAKLKQETARWIQEFAELKQHLETEESKELHEIAAYFGQHISLECSEIVSQFLKLYTEYHQLVESKYVTHQDEDLLSEGSTSSADKEWPHASAKLLCSHGLYGAGQARSHGETSQEIDEDEETSLEIFDNRVDF